MQGPLQECNGLFKSNFDLLVGAPQLLASCVRSFVQGCRGPLVSFAESLGEIGALNLFELALGLAKSDQGKALFATCAQVNRSHAKAIAFAEAFGVDGDGASKAVGISYTQAS